MPVGAPIGGHPLGVQSVFIATTAAHAATVPGLAATASLAAPSGSTAAIRTGTASTARIEVAP